MGNVLCKELLACEVNAEYCSLKQKTKVPTSLEKQKTK